MIKIEIEGTGEEVRKELFALLRLEEAPETAEMPAAEESPARGRRGRKRGGARNPWTEEEAKRLWTEITPDAKRIIGELANQPEGYRQADLMRALGLNERGIGGRLSSVGHAVRRIGNKTAPISKERVNGELVYKLDETVASVVKQLK